MPPSGPVFRRYRIAAVEPESHSACSFELEPAGRRRIGRHAPGQFVTVRADVPRCGPTARSYSLSRAHGQGRLRISVEDHYGDGASAAECDLVAALARGELDGGFPASRAFSRG